MYLSSIELFGFKSFVHRVKITFDKGLTAIVGPNGCGKTNVVDAIRWVLGEQKTSLLRSSKMENIIFNGSRKLKPLSMSEVSLTIENTRNILPTEYTEVTVTRRLYRNGESAYLLNHVPCRLKDILDLFADTGMGSDAYSVIELKMIEEIINNKSDERLRLFEEAAGITRYKQRRKQTFRQLENTARDLERVDDVVKEVSKKVRSLKSQVSKAEQYHALKTSLKQLDLVLGKIDYEEYLGKLLPLEKKIAEQENKVQETAATIASHDSFLQQSELEQLEQERLLSETQSSLNEKNKAAHDLEKSILQMQEQEKNLRENLSRITAALSKKQQQSIELEKEKQQLSLQLLPLEKKYAEKKHELDVLTQEQKNLQNRLDLARKDVGAARESLSEHQKSSAQLHVRLQKLETASDHLTSTRGDLEARKNDLQKIIADSLPAKNRLLEEIDRLKTAFVSKKNEIDKEKKQQQDLDEQLETKKEQLLELRSRLDQLRNKILLANSILDNYEGLPEGIAWLENSNSHTTGYGCLSDLITLEDKHRKAVNAALGDALGYYVCASLPEAKTAIRSLSAAGKGKVTFLVLELVRKPEANRAPAIDNAEHISTLLGASGELRDAIAMLTARSYLARDIETAEKLAIEHPDCIFVTPEGEKIGGIGIVLGGSATESDGLRLGKKAERERLRTAEHDLENEIRAKETGLQGIRKQLLEIHPEKQEQLFRNLEKELADLENNLTRVNAERASLENEIRRAEQDAENALHRKNSIEQERNELLPEIERRQEEEKKLQAALQSAEEKRNEHAGLLDRQTERVQQKNNLHKDSLLGIEKLRFRLHSCEQNRAALARETEHLQGDKQKNETSLASIATTMISRKDELEHVLIASGAEQERLQEMETRYTECKATNQEKRNTLRDLRRKHEVELQIHEELRSRAMALEKSIDSIATSVETRYNCRIETAEVDVPHDFDRESARLRLEKTREQLERFGAVNELALEEYEAEKERLDFLTSQKADLAGAEEQLRKTIHEINKTALQKLNDTFTAVRSNFVRTFRELFDESDEADLLLAAENDPLEPQIEIVAKPRGKKPISIEQLSGGEKTLTALSLLFAIYLVKPSPFCILDEVDAPLDDANIERFIKLLKKFEKNTQFIIVTHNKNTMASSQALYGVTMEEEGVSKLIPVKLAATRDKQLSFRDAKKTGAL